MGDANTPTQNQLNIATVALVRWLHRCVEGADSVEGFEELVEHLAADDCPLGDLSVATAVLVDDDNG